MEKPIRIKAGDVELVGAINIPDKPPQWGVAICHPHPQFGGEMHNNVVIGLARSFASEGFATLRYNMRGVGGSGGGLAGPDGDAADLVEVVDRVVGLEGFGKKIALAGYSYGTVVALKALVGGAGEKIAAAVFVAPPVGMFDMKDIEKVEAPLFISCGDRDAFCPLERLKKNSGSRKIEVVRGVDHFFAGSEAIVSNMAAEFVSSLG